MAYATLDDLKQRLASNTDPPGLYEQLTDRVSFTTANDAVGQEILDAAHGEVNGWLAKRYAVPIDVSTDTTLAQRLKGVTLDLCEKVAWETSTARTTTPKRVGENYSEAIAWLRDVAAGKASLPAVAAFPGPAADGASATALGRDQVFTEDDTAGIF